MRALKPLDEQTIVITGASSGIGRATALMAAGRGARVVLAARTAQAIKEVADDIRLDGGEALAVPTDVADEAQVRALAAQAAAVFGGIDTWVNDAGVSAYATFEELSPEEFERVIAVNFLGTVYGCRAALPYLKEAGGGALICVGSILSDRAVNLQSAYCASKHAVKGLTESLRVEQEQAKTGVQVTLIKPSSINTPLFDHALTKMGVKPKPIAPVYDPNIVAEAICYAAEHRTREVVAGGAGKMLTTLETFAGPVLDRYLVAAGERGQRSADPKPVEGENNLFNAVTERGRIHGDHGGRAVSVYTWGRLHPRLALLGAASAAAALGLRRRQRRRR